MVDADDIALQILAFPIPAAGIAALLHESDRLPFPAKERHLSRNEPRSPAEIFRILARECRIRAIRIRHPFREGRHYADPDHVQIEMFFYISHVSHLGFFMSFYFCLTLASFLRFVNPFLLPFRRPLANFSNGCIIVKSFKN
jgi:hypothetical protein